ncbi:TPA: hypothetical protein ACX6RM_002259 [Photobacterium damselae]
MNVVKTTKHQLIVNDIVKDEHNANIEWCEHDIKVMRQELVYEGLSFLSLTEKKERYSKIKKNEIIRWFLNQEIAPFSSEICFIDMGMNAGRPHE